MSITVKTAGIVYLISFVPIGILGIITWESSQVLGQLLYTFLLMVGFMGVPIYFVTLLYELIIVKRLTKDRSSVQTILKYTIIMNILILIGGLYAGFQYSSNSWNSFESVIKLYINEYLLINLLATIVTILIPKVYSKLTLNLP